MICPKCGADVTGGADSCASCGEPIPDPSSNPGVSSAASAARPHVVYAGFWLRAAAYLVDSLLLGVVAGFGILRPLMERAGIPANNPWVLFTGNSRQILAINLLLTMVSWVYWAVLESSAWRATLGKKMFGIEATDMAGRRMSFARATGRHFAKNISLFTFGLGFVMAGFTEKKQALHDMIAGCLMVRKG